MSLDVTSIGLLQIGDWSRLEWHYGGRLVDYRRYSTLGIELGCCTLHRKALQRVAAAPRRNTALQEIGNFREIHQFGVLIPQHSLNLGLDVVVYRNNNKQWHTEDLDVLVQQCPGFCWYRGVKNSPNTFLFQSDCFVCRFRL